MDINLVSPLLSISFVLGILLGLGHTKVNRMLRSFPDRADGLGQEKDKLRGDSVYLPMQGTWVQSLVREDPTCCGATKPMCHNY